MADLAARLALSAAERRTSTAQIEAWLGARRQHHTFKVGEVPLEDLGEWSFAIDRGALVHASGRFFTVRGVSVRTNHGAVGEWCQPILDQPDRAILGILTQEIDGVLHFLMQAKMEPGNIGTVQLSPTVQATPSNYLRAHRGRTATYVDYFIDQGESRRVLVDVLQSEQGSWFLGKRNRNMVVEAFGPVERHDDFCWLTLGDIRALFGRPHLVNMDSRTVLACLPPALPAGPPGGDGFGDALRRSAAPAAGSRPGRPEAGGWLAGRRAAYELYTRPVPLDTMPGWYRGGGRITHVDHRHFDIMGVEVEATSREVRRWCQPLLAPRSTGLVALVVRRVDGVLQLLVRADVRAGNDDVVEVGPTVQCAEDHPDPRQARFVDLVRSGTCLVRYNVAQSEEGGRLHRAETRHVVVEVDHDACPPDDPDYRWVTIRELYQLIHYSRQVNIETRSLLACLLTLR